EVVHVLRVPADLLPAGRGAVAGGGRRPWAVVVALVVHRFRSVAVGSRPAGGAAYRNTGGARDLGLGHIEVDDERAELAIELAGGIERVLLPAVAIVHDHL